MASGVPLTNGLNTTLFKVSNMFLLIMMTSILIVQSGFLQGFILGPFSFSFSF